LYNFANVNFYVNNSNVCIAVAIKLSLNCLNISRVQLFVFVCRWVCFCQSLTEINIAVEQLDEVDREVKLWSHIGGGHHVSVTSGFRCVDFRKWVPTVRSKIPETDEKWDRSEPGSMGANEKDRRSDKQRSSRSRRSHPMIPARRSPEPDGRVRVSRMPPIPKSAAYVKRREWHSYIDDTGHVHLCWRIDELIEQ